MIRRPPRSTQSRSSAASDVYKRQVYKWFGPHLGALYGKAAVLDRLPAYKVRPAHDRYETGTPSFEAYAGTLAAVDYLRDLGRTYGAAHDTGTGNARGELVTAMGAIAAYE